MKHALIALSLVALVAGCSSVPTYRLSELERSRYENVPSETLVNTLSAKVLAGREARLDYYAPENFANATKALEAAEALHKRRYRGGRLIQFVAAGESFLEDAQANKERAVRVLEKELSLDEELRKMGAAAGYPREYAIITDQLSRVLIALERGRTATVDRDSAKIHGAMSALKVRIIKEKTMREVMASFKALKARGGAELAPKAFAAAARQLERAEAVIQTTPDDSAQIARELAEAKMVIAHAHLIVERVAALLKLDRSRVESIVADEEHWLAGLGEALNAGDLRDKGLDAQAELLVGRVQAVGADLAASRAELAKAEQDKAALQAKVAGYESTANAVDARNARMAEEKHALEEKIAMLEEQLDLLQNLLIANSQGNNSSTPAANQPSVDSAPAAPARAIKPAALIDAALRAPEPVAMQAPAAVTEPAETVAAEIAAPVSAPASENVADAAVPAETKTAVQ